MAVKSLSRDRPVLATIWMLGSMVGFLSLSLFVKALVGTVPSFELIFIRSFINLVLIFTLMAAMKEKLFQGEARMLTIRGVAGFVGIVALFFGIKHLPLAIASLLSWSSPLFVLIFSAIFLGERYSLRSLLFVLGAFAGLFLLLNPDFTHSEIKYGVVALSLAGAASSALAYLTIRKATRTVSANAIVLYFMIVSTLLSLPLAYAEWIWPPRETWIHLLGIGACSTFAQIAMTTAYAYARASFVSLMNLWNPILASIVGFFFFSEQLTAYQVFGMGLVIFNIGILAWREMK